MTDDQILQWIKDHLSRYIQAAIGLRPGTVVTEELLAGITCRETGGLIAKFAPIQKDPLLICSIMRGDLSQRPGETQKQYHGYGLTQVDINSFPDFVHSGDWKDPLKCYIKSIGILEDNRSYLMKHFPKMDVGGLMHYVVAAYNAGVGNESKVIQGKLDPDAYTAAHNYSTQVFLFANSYKSL